MEEHEKLARAKQQVEAIKGFYIHLLIFVLVMTLLGVINITTSSVWWVHWPFLGWDVGVLAHGVMVFGQLPSIITNWQAKKIKELKDKM